MTFGITITILSNYHYCLFSFPENSKSWIYFLNPKLHSMIWHQVHFQPRLTYFVYFENGTLEKHVNLKEKCAILFKSVIFLFVFINFFLISPPMQTWRNIECFMLRNFSELHLLTLNRNNLDEKYFSTPQILLRESDFSSYWYILIPEDKCVKLPNCRTWKTKSRDG